MAFNQLCGVDSNGSGTYTAEGITKLCEGLKGSAVTSLKCAARPKSDVSAPIDSATPHLGSLDNNQLCGLDDDGEGEYTTEGITKLCEGLKESAVTSLRCAVGPSVRLSVNAR